MNREEKGRLYEHYVNQAGALERENSKLKSQYVVNIPENIQKTIDENSRKVAEFQLLLNNLFLM